jgi:hypothetical protein
MHYTKLFSSIITSTIWREDNATRLLWVTMLALADQHGEVHGSIPGLAAMANLTVPECEGALGKLLSPDPYSRTRDEDGRRIEEIDGGWAIINHAKYRALASKEDSKAKHAERQRRYRQKIASRDALVTPGDVSVTVRDESDRANDACVTQGRDIAEAEYRSREVQAEKILNETCPHSSETYDYPQTTDSEKCGRAGGDEQLNRVEKKGIPESVWLAAARRFGIPEAFALAYHIDLTASDWRDRDGNRIVHPLQFLRRAWEASRAQETASPAKSSNGARQPWQVEADITRVKSEISRIQNDRNSRHPHGPSKDDHRRKHQAQWLDVVKGCYLEAKGKLPNDVASFQVHWDKKIEEMTKAGLKDVATDEGLMLEEFATYMPEDDVPSFNRWDREWNRQATWCEPGSLTEGAKDQVRLLKTQLQKLQSELVNALKA